MPKVLVTGMSGTGKSTALDELNWRGFRVVDTDEPGWTAWDEQDDGYVWREDRVGELLSLDDGPTLYVSGTVSNQGRFYQHFDAVGLLSAPAEVLLSRIDCRTTNRYGKAPDERELILRDLAEVEPLRRATCTHEIDAIAPRDAGSSSSRFVSGSPRRRHSSCSRTIGRNNASTTCAGSPDVLDPALQMLGRSRGSRAGVAGHVKNEVLVESSPTQPSARCRRRSRSGVNLQRARSSTSPTGPGGAGAPTCSPVASRQRMAKCAVTSPYRRPAHTA
jgi:hypothetical protein